jgi:hypothetical protein
MESRRAYQVSVKAETFVKIENAAKAASVTLGTIIERALAGTIQITAEPKRRPRRMAGR